jgi:hypothetical protein
MEKKLGDQNQTFFLAPEDKKEGNHSNGIHYRSTATMSTAVITTKEFKGIGHKQHCATCQQWVTNIKHHSQQFVPALE